MKNTLKEYTDYLIQVVEAFDYDDADWALVVVEDNDGYSSQFPVNDGLADLLREIKDVLKDNNDYDG